MEKHICDEKNGLSYTLCGDYYLPDLVLNEEEPTYGKYGMLLIMQNKLFLKAADICELLEVKQTSAYEIIGNLNKELEEQGYLTLRGKVPTKYFVKRFYGVEDTCEIPQEEGKEWFHA